MTILNTLGTIGYDYDTAEGKERFLVVTRREAFDENGILVPELNEGKRRIGVRLVPKPDAEPATVPLIPAVTINEHSSEYQLTADGFTVEFDKPRIENGRDIGRVQVEYHQANSRGWEEVHELPHFPFQTQLRSSEPELRYNPIKAKYHDFRQDFSVQRATPFLNEFELSSFLAVWNPWKYRAGFKGTDYRQFGVLYIEFRDDKGNPVANPIYKDMEIPSRFGHFITVDLSRSIAHIHADMLRQTQKIHSDILLTLNPYEGHYRSLHVVLPLGWNCYCPGLYFPGYEVTEWGQGEDALSADGKTRVYQEELVMFNRELQSISISNLGQDGHSESYPDVQREPFPFPARDFFPFDEGGGEVEIPWNAVDFSTTAYTTSVTVPVEAYVYNQNRPWQVYAPLKVKPEAGEIALKNAVWKITTDVDGSPVTEKYPAYFVREIVGNAQPMDNGEVIGEEVVQHAKVLFDRSGLPYTERSISGNTVIEADGTSDLFLRVCPPALDDHGTSPYININPVEAELVLTFHRPDVDDRVEFFMGDDAVLQGVVNSVWTFDGGVLKELSPVAARFTRTVVPATENEAEHVLIESNHGFDWSGTFLTRSGFYIGPDRFQDYMKYLDDPEYQVEGDLWAGDESLAINGQLLRHLIREDGSVIIPTTIGQVGTVNADDTLMEHGFELRFIYIGESGNPKDNVYLGLEKLVKYKLHDPAFENDGIAAPFAITDLVQNRTPAEVELEICLYGDVQAVASATLDQVDPVTKKVKFFSKVADASLEGLKVNVIYDHETDTLTVDKLGGPKGMLSINVRPVDADYTGPNFPAELKYQSTTHQGWANTDPEDLTTVDVSKYIFELPYDAEGDIYEPEVELEATYVALPADMRASLNGLGLAYSETDAGLAELVLDNDSNATEATFSVNLNEVIFATAQQAELSGVKERGLAHREFVALRITDADYIAKYDRETPDQKPNAADVNFLLGDSEPWETIRKSECKRANEEGVEVLYIPVPLYFAPSYGELDYNLSLRVKHGGWKEYAGKTLHVTGSFKLPVEVLAVTQPDANKIVNLADLASQATEIITWTYGEDNVGLTDISRIVDLSSQLYWDHAAQSSPIPGENGLQEAMYINRYADTYNASVAAGYTRPKGAVFHSFLRDVVIPEGFAVDITPFYVYQGLGGVHLFARLAPLELTLVELPFKTFSLEYYLNGDQKQLIQKAELDKTLLPGDLASQVGSVAITTKLNYGNFTAGGTLYYAFDGVATYHLGSYYKANLPDDVANLGYTATARLYKPWEAEYRYTAERQATVQ